MNVRPLSGPFRSDLSARVKSLRSRQGEIHERCAPPRGALGGRVGRAPALGLVCRSPCHTGARHGRFPPWTAVRPGTRVVSSRPDGHPSGRSPLRPTAWPDVFLWSSAVVPSIRVGRGVRMTNDPVQPYARPRRRPPWCPLAPFSRPSQGVRLGRLSGQVSEWVSSRRLKERPSRPPVVPDRRGRAG
jgi:hypothetical protein